MMDSEIATREPRHVRVAIVGSGFAGLGAAIRLTQAGVTDFAVFERADDVGGVWRDNTYPGCACDVESHLYAFSFAPNPQWSRTHARQPEILAYLRDCATRFGVVPHVCFGHELEEATYDAGAQRWRLTTNHGAWTADVVISGAGALSEPMIPDLPGMERFTGAAFHSARWDHGVDLRGRHVAVIGSGASAVQFVPEIATAVASLTLLQRTPAWVIPGRDRPTSDLAKWLFREVPGVRALFRAGLYLRRELLVPGFRHPALMAVLERFARRYLASEVRDPDLRRRLTPRFRLGCKRILVSSRYLRTLTRPNVQVVTVPVRDVRARSLVTADGAEHPVDVLIFSTGFRATDPPLARRVRGRDGRTLREVWAGSPQALHGTTVAGFPNLFLLLGPNTYLGHTSVVLMVEHQIDLLLAALRHLDRHGLATLEPRADAQARFVRDIDAALSRTVWATGGCASWYLDQTGRNSVLWPGWTSGFRRAARFDPADYLFERGRQARQEAT